MKKLMVANWKMNQNTHDCQHFFFEFNKRFSEKREAWVAPQSLYLRMAHELGFKKHVRVGAQNCSEHVNGAYTGELSARNIKDVGGSFVIIGHSERRQYFNESSKTLNAKLKTALAEGLKVIFCLGETLEQRTSNQTFSIIADQIHQGLPDLSLASEDNLIIAYEPVWAIGTGKTASPAEAQEVHAFIRQTLKEKYPAYGEKVRLLYGGSVKPDNVEELLAQPDIDGGLVGGASLKPYDFLALCGDK
jgi:triosephosphate isomerase (TIM)